jgi:hypothetical protein
MRIGLLIDGARVTRWQANALARLGADHDLRIYNCTNAPAPRRQLRHWPYYVLNLISLRSDETRPAPMAADLDFECVSRRRLAAAAGRESSTACAPIGIQVIVKFGSGLAARARCGTPADSDPVLPSRAIPAISAAGPAGFYELLSGRRTDRPSGPDPFQPPRRRRGRGLRGNARPSATVTARQCAKHIAPRRFCCPRRSLAVREERALDTGTWNGKVTRLPRHGRHLLRRDSAGRAKLRRLAYGRFVEKQWWVAQAPRCKPARIV